MCDHPCTSATCTKPITAALAASRALHSASVLRGPGAPGPGSAELPKPDKNCRQLATIGQHRSTSANSDPKPAKLWSLWAIIRCRAWPNADPKLGLHWPKDVAQLRARVRKIASPRLGSRSNVPATVGQRVGTIWGNFGACRERRVTFRVAWRATGRQVPGMSILSTIIDLSTNAAMRCEQLFDNFRFFENLFDNFRVSRLSLPSSASPRTPPSQSKLCDANSGQAARPSPIWDRFPDPPSSTLATSVDVGRILGRSGGGLELIRGRCWVNVDVFLPRGYRTILCCHVNSRTVELGCLASTVQ